MSEDKGQERRVFHRITFDAPAMLHQGSKAWPASLLDISMKGLLLKKPEGFDGNVKDPFEIVINLGKEGEAIVMSLRLAHLEADHLGMRCDYIDIDSITHLKRLVELNLGDSELLNRELSALVSGR